MMKYERKIVRLAVLPFPNRYSFAQRRENLGKGKKYPRARARSRANAPRKKLGIIRANPRGHNFPREFHFADIGGYTRGYPLASFAGNKRQFAQIAEFLILI